MRILHVSEVHWGGVVPLLAHYAFGQTNRGHEVHLLAPPAFPELRATRHDWCMDRRRAMTFLQAARELRRVTRQVQPDVIHLHSFMAGFLGRLPGVIPLSSAPVVYQPHSWAFDLFTNPKKAAVVRTWERWANSRTTALVVNCADELEEGRKSGIRNDGFPLGVAVDLKHFRPPTAADREQARKNLGLTARNVIVVISRLTYQKGQDLLVPAWERSPLEETALILVGPGDPAPLAKLAPTEWGRSIHAVGESRDVRGWLWAADLLALPSRYEGESVGMGEAMACGLPVVSNAVNGAREALLDGPLPSAGVVVEVGDAEGMLVACLSRLEDRELWREESAYARRRATALFDPGRVVVRLEEAYVAATKKCGRG